jgi:hypothetical protein
VRNFTRNRQYLSMTRIIAGLIVAPFLGLLLYFIAFSFQSPFSFDAFSSMVMSSLIYFFSIISNLGPYFLVLALILGTIVMLLLMKYYSWNIAICVIGSVINAFLVVILFLILLLLTGASFMPALVGSVRLLSLITVPAILAGILFWFIVVFKNTSLRTYWKMEVT